MCSSIPLTDQATFRSLTSSSLWDDLQQDGILVTVNGSSHFSREDTEPPQGKGYPDMATRTLLKLLTEPSPRNNNKYCPTFGLADFDPDGLSILSTYKYGSLNLAHEILHLSLPTMDWVGVKSSHFMATHNCGEEQRLLRLSYRDRRKAACMLGREPFSEDGEEPGWRREVQTMLMLNVKAEIQFLETRAVGLASWLRTELNRRVGD